MSTCRKEGKDVIIFATADDHKEPSNVELPEIKPEGGLILPNGEFNWNCPCLEGMASGPCGLEFKEAFLCFHKSETEPKGMDCYNRFETMRLCMDEYPELYRSFKDNEEEDIDNIDIKLSDAEKALINDDSVTEVSESIKGGSFPKVEDKPADEKSRTEVKSPSKSSTPATGALKINM